MNTAQALAALGIDETAVTPEQLASFDELGYCIFPDVFTGDDLEAMRAEVDRLQAIEGAYGGHEVHIEPGAMRLSNLFNKSPEFDRCLRCGPTLTLAHRLMGEIRVYSLNARNPAKGQGQQLLHSDVPRAHATDWRLVNTMVMLDDMTEDNGPTRVVPGSHKLVPINVPDINMCEFDRILTTPEDEAVIPKDPMATHPKEVHLMGKAGSIAVINARIWHGGTINRSGARRRVLHLAIGRRDVPQQFNEREHLTRGLHERTGPAERFLLDIEGAEPKDIDPLELPKEARLWKAADVERVGRY
ncbi:phytanoyl-CoA dioxygenase family protein [Caballeronia sp. INDeC2]|uniref:phytanoyl-CoA dioxygenase family protein n=1 Tax=Caballeronia sp. INDeC2 TaxID=2921747 RepID=UPI0020279B10|nr:phytanoyl-CoA dioxygenase family protein [Caballeronia sp. INDeC2]